MDKITTTERDLDTALMGSMLLLRPGRVVPPEWLKNFELCIEYQQRFGVSISLPFWFMNSMHVATALIQDSLVKDRRRWILECGPWGDHPTITSFRSVIESAGRTLETISLEDTQNLWLDPVEWIEAPT
jgi:hypothetical protein